MTNGVWDGLEPDASHLDLNTDVPGRVTIIESFVGNAYPKTLHSTHVTATMSGDGRFNTVSRVYAGVAPRAKVFTWDCGYFLNWTKSSTEMANAAANQRIVISQNSWGNPPLANCNLYGSYTGECADYDTLVRTNNLAIFFAAGNSQNATWPGTTSCGAFLPVSSPGRYYRTITPLGTAKNVVAVGAVAQTTDQIWDNSSLGPTKDGRVKPDVVALGESVKSCAPPPPTQFLCGNPPLPVTVSAGDPYFVVSGTSMACPAVSGTAALLIELFRDIYGPAQPSPALLKAVLCNTADDLGNAGPDYKFGYGRVNALTAANTIQDQRFVDTTNGISANVSWTNSISVGTGCPNLRVMLVWSDVECTVGCDSHALVNDLDLTVVGPSGTHLPYTLDAANPGVAAMQSSANHTDNVEQVVINNAVAGTYHLIVKSPSVLTKGPQPFALTWISGCGATNPCGDFVNGDLDFPVPVNGTGSGWTSSNLQASPSGWSPTTGYPSGGGAFLINNQGETNDPTLVQTVGCLVSGLCYTIHGKIKVQSWNNSPNLPSFGVLRDGQFNFGTQSLLDGNSVATGTKFYVGDNDTAWHEFSINFIATATSHTISFAAEIDGTDASYYLDNVWLERCGCLQISCPSNLTAGTCSDTTNVAFTVSAYNSCYPTNFVTVLCTPPSGFPFPQGKTPVHCVATDQTTGHSVSCDFDVVVTSDTNSIPCSTFDCGRDGWTAANRSSVTWLDIAIGSVALTYNPAGGTGISPGYISSKDVGDVNYLRAPSKFLGNQSAYLCGRLSFDLENDHQGGVFVAGSNFGIILQGAGIMIETFLATPATIWQHYTVPLSAPGWFVWNPNNLTLTPASDTDFANVLANLTVIDILGDFSLANDTTGLDNFCFEPCTTNLPPVIYCPPNIVVTESSCTNVSVITNFTVTAENCCGCTNPPVVVCTPPSPGPFGLGTTNVHCVATDCNGNTNSCDFTVTVLPPPLVINCSSNKTVPCGSAWSFDTPTANDPCCSNTPTITVVSTVTSGVCQQVNTRTWLATSACGGSNTCSHTVTVQDFTLPVVNCPTNKTVTCGTAWSFDTPTASDACSGTNVTISIIVTTNAVSGVCTQTNTRLWKISDCAGNSKVCSQRLTALPTSLMVSCPTNKTVECGSGWSFDQPIVTGSCSNVISSVTYTNGLCTQMVTRVWTITNGCSQSATCTQTVTVVDTTPPVINCASNKTVECYLCPTYLPGPTNGGVVVHFTTAVGNGRNPVGGVIQGSNGMLYGTTQLGGSNNVGTLYRIYPDGGGYAVLRSFTTNGVDGQVPQAGLAEAFSGDLYGTTVNGGSNAVGTVFKMNQDGTGYSIWKNFSANDGTHPKAALLQAADGVLYGTVADGGSNGVGTVFKLNTNGSGFAVLHHFGATAGDGQNPSSALAQGDDGALYGTAYSGGGGGVGTVFKLNTDGTGFAVLHSFSNSGGDGQNPNAGLLPGSDGVLYGTTRFGGTNGLGTVFKLNPDGTGYAVLHSFNGADGSESLAGLAETWDGALVGATDTGGTNGLGVVFTLNKDGTGYLILQEFTGPDGANPRAAPVQGNDGALYGTTVFGDTNNVGTLFTLKCDPPWKPDKPTASDACSGTNVTLSLFQTTTNGVCPRTFTYSWRATDLCGNSSICSQTITVADTTPPAIRCKSNIVVTSCIATQVFYRMSVSDACCTNVQVTYTPPSGSVFPLGTSNVTCVVVDCCNNTNTCNFKVTVKKPKVIIIANPANGVGSVVVNFATAWPCGGITNWHWTFGDSITTNVTTGGTVTHTYGPGVFTVTLITSDTQGFIGTNTEVNLISVLTPFQNWQLQYFGCTNCPQAQGGADVDGDGMSNTNEFLTGTNPTNSLSSLRIVSVVRQFTNIVLTWRTAGGFTNAVQMTSGVGNGSYSTNFTDLSGQILIGGSGDASTNYTDVGGATNVPARYYRVRLVP